MYWAVNTVWLNSGGAEEIPPSCSLSLPHSRYIYLSVSRSLVCFLFLLRCFMLFLSVIVFSFVYVPLHGRVRKQNGRAKLLPLSLPWKMSRYLSSRKLDALVPCPGWYAEFYANFCLMECVIAPAVWYKRTVVKLGDTFAIFWILGKAFYYFRTPSIVQTTIDELLLFYIILTLVPILSEMKYCEL